MQSMSFLGNCFLGVLTTTLFALSVTTPLAAEWEDIGRIDRVNESLDVDNCGIRIEALHANAIEHIAMTGSIHYINDQQVLKFNIGADQIALLLSGRELTSFFHNFRLVSEPKNMVLQVETNMGNRPRLFLHGVSSGTLVGYAANIADNLQNLTLQRNCQNANGPAERISGLSATASSSYANSSFYSAFKGVDQDRSTFWAPHQSDTSETFTVELNGSYLLDRGTITWYQGYEGTNITVLTSTDGVNFNTTLPASAVVRNGSETTVSFSDVAATHIRIRINQHNQFVPILIESEFFGWSN